MNAKRLSKLLFGILLVVLMGISIFYIARSNKEESKSAGAITFIVNSMDNEILEKKRIEYQEGDTLFDVLDKTYTLTYQESVYGHYIIGIASDSFTVETDGFSSWIWFELFYIKENIEYNEEISFSDYEEQDVLTGIDGLKLENNMIFAMNHRDQAHASSIKDNTISFKKEDNSKKIGILISSILGGILIVGILIAFILKKKNNEPISVKELSIMAALTAILFVQEEVLTFIPNFQFTFLLLAVYVTVFGLRKTTYIVFTHVLLDNLVMGSLTPIVMIPMLIGYMVYITIVYFFRNYPLWSIIVVASLGSLLYCYFFMIANVWFLSVPIMPYWISDIPFEILLVLSTIFTLMYLYKPLVGKLNMLLNKE